MIYNLLLFLLYPFIIVYSIFHKKTRDFFVKRLFQNFDIDGDYVWFHMASVGEVNLSEPLIRKFANYNEYKIMLTVMTDTGYNEAQKKYGNIADIFYFPIDNIFVIRKILKKISLKKVILVETEIWPNLINEAYKHASISIINGRISDKSFNSYKKLKWYLKGLFDKISYFIMQTNVDMIRIVELGAKEEKVFNFGNMKFDIQLNQFTKEELLELKERFGIGSSKVFVAGSTREGEEEFLLEVFDKLDGYKLILVPRHLERLGEIEKLLAKRNYTLWSKEEKGKDIILVDKMGVLRKLYALSDITFVGGTLVNIGGHSLLEPLFYMKLPIFGKFTQNVKDISNEIIKREIGYRVSNLNEFLEAIKKVEANIENNDEIIKFFSENNKVCDKTFDLLIDTI